MNNSMMNWIKSKCDYNNLPETLPAMHSCETFDCENIIKDLKLKVKRCPVFDEELLYFFYGKPSYPVGEKNIKNRNDILDSPACLIIDTNLINLYRVFPFDSGAFMKGLYSPFIHRHMDIKEFEIDNNIDDIRAYISVVFKTNENYLHNECKETKSDNTYCDALLRMLGSSGGYEFDERCCAVEIISKDSVDIVKAIKGIVIPENMLNNITVRDFILTNKIEYKTYSVRNFTCPSRYNEVVFQMALELGKRR